jgi:hypothetical protein
MVPHEYQPSADRPDHEPAKMTRRNDQPLGPHDIAMWAFCRVLIQVSDVLVRIGYWR